MSLAEVVLVRSVYGGRVRWAFPHRVVSRDPDGMVLYLSPGTEGVLMGRDADGRYIERWARGDDPLPHVWREHHVLWLVRRSHAHSLGLFWDESWSFKGWYVNLQAPLEATSLGFDTTDWALDVQVDPDGTWSWKDEEDFAELKGLGVLTAAEAAEIRAEGRRVIGLFDELLPTGWEEWRPDPAWRAPVLPEGWDVV